jgi:hypothetical protein
MRDDTESVENDGDGPRDLEYDVPDKTLAGLGPEGAISPGAISTVFQ